MSDLDLFADGWCAPDLPTLDQWGKLLEAGGHDVMRVEDLTALHTPRTPAELDRLETATRRAMQGTDDWDRVLRMGELGGFALERLYHASAMTYAMIVACKP